MVPSHAWPSFRPHFTYLTEQETWGLPGKGGGWEQFPERLRWSCTAELRVPCSLPQPPLPISQPPVNLLPGLQHVACVGSRWRNGVPGLLLLASLSQLFAARWVWVLTGHAWGMAASSQLAHGLAP